MKFSATSLALCAVTMLLTGCISSKYKLARPEDTTRPTAFNLAVNQPPVEARLNTVIVYKGPGSWKREAYWDEYVVTLANRGATPLTIESATLVDFQGATCNVGTDPWQLENQSKTAWQKIKSSQTGNLLALGAGTVVVSGGLVGIAVAAGGFSILGTTTTTAAVSLGAATVVLAAAPVYAVTTIVINSKNKKHVLAEFERRRLTLPHTLAPDQVAQGSLFFRVAPGPQRLCLRCRAADEPFDVVLELAPLAGLHMKKTPADGDPAAR